MNALTSARKRSSSLSSMEIVSGLPERLQHRTIFQGLEESVLHRLTARLHLRVYRDGDVIIRQGEEAKALFVMISGTAVAYSETSECVLSAIQPGAVFGEIGIIYGCKRTATVRAASPICKVAVLQREDLEEALKEGPLLLERLRERARLHLQADQQRESDMERVAVTVSDMKVFEGFPFWEQDTLRLFLTDCKTFLLKPMQRIIVSSGAAYMLVKGQGALIGAMGAEKSLEQGDIYTPEQTESFDIIQARTTCVLMISPATVYANFIEGYSVHYSDEDEFIDPIEQTILTRRKHSGGIIEADRDARKFKKQRRQEKNVDFSSHPSAVTDSEITSLNKEIVHLNLSGCWQVSDAALEWLCTNATCLQTLRLSDCWNLSETSLKLLSGLHGLQALSMANLDPVNDQILNDLPTSLKALDISYCSNVADYASLENLSELCELKAHRCGAASASTPLSDSLQKLDITECSHLTDEMFNSLSSKCKLSILNVSGCTSLGPRAVDVICRMTDLKVLDVSNCNNLVNDISLKTLLKFLEELEELSVSHCDNIHNLLDLVKDHPKIQKISFSHCGGLGRRQMAALSAKFDQ